MSHENDVQEQIIDLQSRVLFQEDTLQQLSDMIAQQDKQIQWLQQQLTSVTDKLKEQSYQQSQSDGGDIIERPPHY